MRSSLISAGVLAGSRFLIEDVYPSVDGGRFPVKRVAGEPFEVWADIYRDGHAVIAARLLWRHETKNEWHREPFVFHGQDRWSGAFTPPAPGRYFYAIEAWTDEWATWRRDAMLKVAAGQRLNLEWQEGAEILRNARIAHHDDGVRVALAVARFDRDAEGETLLGPELAEAMERAEPASDLTLSSAFALTADRMRARCGAWYEMMPRSQGATLGRHGTFDDCIARIPEIAALGFDVLYLLPIHPIGEKNRKGRNNALRAAPGDPGSPYAIGGHDGGHDAVHRELGTLQDFRRLVTACAEQGMEVALDFAVQCSPDHPWLKDHPDWFSRRPDGSIRYAENPPKKYEDIVNPDFYGKHQDALWNALLEVVFFWREQGVRIFRVDNPHTKALGFWEWLVREVQSVDPDIIFLAEAFTRPKVMKGLAKLGFTQSYTYFTWRTGKAEIQEYLSELTRYPESDYYRPNFFVSTPDILPFHLQGGEARIFKARVALAATSSATYGVYNGFELLEHEPIPGKEEYLDSEKYEIKVRDWNRVGHIKDYIGRLNTLRRENAALQQTSNLRFLSIDDDDVIGFVKDAPSHGNAVAVVIALSQPHARSIWVHFGGMDIGPDDERRPIKEIEDLATGQRHILEWGGIRVSIDPNSDPALMFRCWG